MAGDCTLGTARSKSSRRKGAAGAFYPEGTKGDVLQVVQSLGKMEFTLAEVYAHAGSLAKLHPQNRHVRDKIRQQVRVLRDLGLLEFLGSGSYCLI